MATGRSVILSAREIEMDATVVAPGAGDPEPGVVPGDAVAAVTTTTSAGSRTQMRYPSRAPERVAR